MHLSLECSELWWSGFLQKVYSAHILTLQNKVWHEKWTHSHSSSISFCVSACFPGKVANFAFFPLPYHITVFSAFQPKNLVECLPLKLESKPCVIGMLNFEGNSMKIWVAVSAVWMVSFAFGGRVHVGSCVWSYIWSPGLVKIVNLGQFSL